MNLFLLFLFLWLYNADRDQKQTEFNDQFTDRKTVEEIQTTTNICLLKRETRIPPSLALPDPFLNTLALHYSIFLYV